jgi:hypothetical protein
MLHFANMMLLMELHSCFSLGPVVGLIDGRITLIGIVSFTIGDLCTGTRPEGLFRVSHEIEWIRKNTDVSEWKCNSGTHR